MNHNLLSLPLHLFLFVGPCALALAQAQPNPRIVPRHPFAVELPELGRMFGIPGMDCAYGFLGIHPIGDCNNDSLADWIIPRRRCDTSVNGTTPEDLLLYKGVRGRLPATEDRLRIGPTEIGSSVKFLAAGDWDGDTHLDIAMSMKVFGDTSFGEPNTIGLSHVVILWGNAEGSYGVDDTTRLENGTVGWLTPGGGYTHDFNHDGVDDLLLVGIRGFQDGEVKRTMPGMQVFLGGARWGNEYGRRSDWGCWSWPVGELSFVDQDADGLTDFIFTHNTGSSQDFGAVRIIYGTQGVIIDTANVVEVSLAPANGKHSLLADISGDKVPELLVNTGGQETLKAYIGLKGQRITEQFGSGDEPPHPGEDVWWGKPWAAIPLPNKLHDGWAAAGWEDILNLGDGGLDGVGDAWTFTVPDIIFYNGGRFFDSLYDGWINIPCGGGTALEVLGDIDGSGKRTIALGYLCNGTQGIKFVQASDSVPKTGRFRQLPPGTDTVSAVASSEWRVASGLGVQVFPNPANGAVRIIWRRGDPPRRAGSETRGNGDASIAVRDMLGQEVITIMVPAYRGEAVWNAARTFSGTYLITVTIGDVSETAEVIIQR